MELSEQPDAVPAEPWRGRLGRRLSQLMAGMSPVVLVPIAVGTDSHVARGALLVMTCAIFAAFLVLARKATSPTARSVGVVAAFAGIGISGYATVGFLSAPAVAFALSVALAGLLLGRRAMVLTALAVCACVFVIAALMIRDVIPAPPMSDISPRLVRPWIRTSIIMMLLVLALGAVVTWVVENMEAALRRADEEALRRRDAERHVLRAQRRELMVQLAGGLAHDVNNQLTVISAWNSLAASGRDPARRAQASEAISAAVDSAAALTQRLLVLGRADVRNPRALDLRELVRAYEVTLRGFLPADIVVQVEAEQACWCRADEAQLHRVLLNLAVNARDAMPDGGVLKVRARRRSDASAMGVHGPLAQGDWAVLEVQDEGVGMDPETRRRAFDPFFTTKKAGKGTGLGLATIAAIAEQSGGGVVLDSEPGRGTRIEAWFPTCEPRTVPEAASTAVTALGNARVLLSEDTAGVRSAACEALSQAGCSVVVAADGDEALARIAEESFDVLCSDVVMPGAPVTQVIEAMTRKNPSARVLLCSGYVGEELVRRGIEEGRYHFLPKPYTLAALIERVGEVLGDDRATPAS